MSDETAPEPMPFGETGTEQAQQTRNDIQQELRAERDKGTHLGLLASRLEERIRELEAQVEWLRDDRDRFQKIVHAVSPVLDPAALGKDAEGFAATARGLVAEVERLRAECMERAVRQKQAEARLARVAKEYEDYVEGVSGTGEPDPRFRERFPALVEALAAAQPEEKPQ